MKKILFLILSFASIFVGHIQLDASSFSNYACTRKEGIKCVGKCPGAKKPSLKEIKVEQQKPCSLLSQVFDVEVDEHECAFDATIGEFSLVKAAEPRKLYSFILYSSNITAPIYNLPLQRSMIRNTKEHGWWLSATPFIQPNIKPFYFTPVAMSDAGMLFGLGYNGSRWYMRGIVSLSGNRISYACNDSIHKDIKLGADSLFALGLQMTGKKKWKLNCEGFVGFSNEKHAFVNIAALGTGVQANFDYTIAENARSKYELSVLSRFTCFVPKSLKFIDHADGKIIGNGSYTPGSFLDLFFAFKQYYGSNYQHSIDLGYNPTFHVQDQIVKKISNNTDTIELNAYCEQIPKTRHTIYGIYGYNWAVGNLPMNINIGSSVSFGSGVDSYGTFFTTFGLGF